MTKKTVNRQAMVAILDMVLSVLESLKIFRDDLDAGKYDTKEGV